MAFLIGSGRTLSTRGGAPFRAFPKSLSLDFGGLSHAHNTLSSAAPPPVTQDKYAAFSQLDKVFSDTHLSQVRKKVLGISYAFFSYNIIKPIHKIIPIKISIYQIT